MGKANTTRAEPTEPIGGKDAADKLNKVFYVYGEKTVNDETHLVFNTYKVNYINNPANPSASNTKGWEYVGIDWNSNERKNVAGENATAITQTIKYWDYSASKYTFYAFSAKPDDVTKPDDVNSGEPKIKVSQIDKSGPTSPSYTVTIKDGADIEKLYFADKVTINKPSTPPITADPAAEGKYGGYVKLTFRNLAAKVRVGFYETVPGYSIKINNMYPAKEAGDDFDATAPTTKFVAMCPNYEASKNSQITVKYYGTGEVAENQAYVAMQDENGAAALQEANTLTLGTGVFGSELNTTSSSPTWDTTNGAYTFFWPQTGNDKPLKIKVDYTLTSTDNSGEKIEVKGATATVPADYVKWKANTAYTYIFKISDNTNGSTGTPGTAPAGLYPITFDAVVEDYANEGSTTTVSTPSVTAKQDGTTNGEGTTNGYESVNGNSIVFKTGKTIDLKVMNGNADVTSSATITGGYINSYDYGKTPEQNLKAHSQSQDFTTTQPNPLALQNSEGYWVLKVTYSNGETNVFTYVIIRVGSAEEYPAIP